MSGSYSVADPDGRIHTVTYTADAVHGFFYIFHTKNQFPGVGNGHPWLSWAVTSCSFLFSNMLCNMSVVIGLVNTVLGLRILL